MTDHLPDRATWDCGACHGSWPCPTARQELIGEQDPRTLARLMATEMERAIAVLPRATPGALHERFLAWTRPGWAS
jgi:hypothetical protein